MKAILFDFDGVLTIDSTGTTSIVNYFAEKTAIDSDRFEKAYRKHNYDLLYGHTTHEKVWQSICADFGADIDINLLYNSFVETPLDKKMLNLARKLKKNGYLIGMITDNKADRIEQILEHHKMNDLFDVVAISARIKSGKKDEVIFNETINELLVKFNECIFIDNNPHNLKIPDSKGMSTIFFDHNERNYVKLEKRLVELGVNVRS